MAVAACSGVMYNSLVFGDVDLRSAISLSLSVLVILEFNEAALIFRDIRASI